MDEPEKHALEQEGETVIFPKDGDYAIQYPDGSVMMCSDQPESVLQCQLIDLLCELTELGKAIWLRREVDVGWLYCFIGNEQIIVDFSFYEELDTFDWETIDSETSFMVHYRGDRLPYFGGLFNGDKFISLIRGKDIPVDDAEVSEHIGRCRNHLLDRLIELKSDLL